MKLLLENEFTIENFVNQSLVTQSEDDESDDEDDTTIETKLSFRQLQGLTFFYLVEIRLKSLRNYLVFIQLFDQIYVKCTSANFQSFLVLFQLPEKCRLSEKNESPLKKFLTSPLTT